MTALYKHRILLDLDQVGHPLQVTIELHTLDGRTVHSISTWTPGPFDTPIGCLVEAIYEIEERYGTQPSLPL